MSEQTEKYIVLKPIAERFSRVANSITDEEIRSLIKQEMRVQLKDINFGYEVRRLVDEYMENNEEKVLGMVENSLKEKFNN